MALDPRLVVFLDNVNQAPPTEGDVDLGAARDGWALINALDGEPEPVAHIDDGTFPGPGGPVRYRRYRPTDEEVLPALVWFHGGGFVLGSLDTTDRTARKLANRSGVCVVSVDYRLAPEHPFPAAVDDAWAATTWVRDNAAALGIDPARLAVGGDSAGGNLAAVVAQRAAIEGLPLSFQLLLYPWLDGTMSQPALEENAEGYLLTEERIRWFHSNYLAGEYDRRDPRLSPLHGELGADLAPAQIVVAGFDPLRDDGIAYAKRLTEAGLDADLVRFDDQIHAFATLAMITPRGGDALEVMGRAVRKALSPPR